MRKKERLWGRWQLRGKRDWDPVEGSTEDNRVVISVSEKGKRENG